MSILQVNGLYKTYKKRKEEAVTAVDNVSFKAKKGEILAILGPNGAGKTTIIKMITSLVIPDQGQVIINNYDISKKKQKALEHCACVLEGSRNIYWRLSVLENMFYFASIRGIPFNKEVKEYADFLINLLDLDINKNEEVRKLSRGNQQKAAIACAMLPRTDILLLDEPTLGLDIEISIKLREKLAEIAKQENRLLIITTHDMKLVEKTAERVIIINKGHIIADDKTSNLTNLFKTIAFKITFKQSINEIVKEDITKLKGLLDYIFNDNCLELTLSTHNHFYDLIDCFRKHKLDIINLETESIDFEKVFLKIVDNDRNTRLNNV